MWKACSLAFHPVLCVVGVGDDLIRQPCGLPPSPEGEGCYVVPLCQEIQQINNVELTLDDQKEHQAKQTPALATLLYVDWDNQRKSDTDRSMVRRER